MAFFIRADFPLGIYQGRDRRGVIERYPSTLRLHSALVAGAYSLCRLRNSMPTTDIVDLDARSSAALDWLETNTPDAVSFPRSVINDGGRARAYRDKGTASLKKASELAVEQVPQQETGDFAAALGHAGEEARGALLLGLEAALEEAGAALAAVGRVEAGDRRQIAGGQRPQLDFGIRSHCVSLR